MKLRTLSLTWKGKNYVYSDCGARHIVLPDRTVLSPVSDPCAGDPFATSFQEVEHPFQHTSVGEIALYLGDAVLAAEAE